MIFGKTYVQQDAERGGLWYAWHPVRLADGRRCWLERVWRKYESHSPFDYGWQYTTTGSLT